ncbi:hypothetical protein HK101_006622, partial [Irineochytrium annulatum]
MAFGVIEKLFEMLEERGKEYVQDVQTIAWAYVNSKEKASVKKAALSVLTATITAGLPEGGEVASMTQRLFKLYVQNESKFVASVKSALLDLFGASCRYYKDDIDSKDVPQIKRKYISILSSALSPKPPDLEVIAGALNGVATFMFSFELDSKELDKLVEVLKHTIRPIEDLTRYAVPRAALNFMHNHADKFGDRLLTDKASVFSVFTSLRRNCGSKNTEVSKLAYKAVDAYLKSIAAAVTSSDNKELGKDVFWYLVKEYITILRTRGGDEGRTGREISHAVRAVGILAPCCKKFMDP